MIAEIFPSNANGKTFAPPSKSIAHRALICAALSESSVVRGISFSQDITATLNCLKILGADVKRLSDTSVSIGGLKPNKIKSCDIFCNESGSTLRFLIPLCLLSNQKIFLSGSKRLFERPLDIYKEICHSQNLIFEKSESGISVCGILNGGVFNIDGSVSSQFITGLLFALPLTDKDSKIILSENSESLSYIQLTLDMLKKFGIKFKRENKYTFIVKGRQKYRNADIEIEGDYSNAAFLDAFNCFNSNVAVKGLNKKSAQGDKVYKDYFKQICCFTPEISLKDCPDLGPVLFTLAAAKNGAVFYDTNRLRIKESDRVEAMKTELEKFGAKIICEDNKVTVIPSALNSPKAELCSHNDHRIAMSLAVLSSVYGGKISGAESVRKSFPDFFEKISDLGIKVKIYDA